MINDHAKDGQQHHNNRIGQNPETKRGWLGRQFFRVHFGDISVSIGGFRRGRGFRRRRRGPRCRRPRRNRRAMLASNRSGRRFFHGLRLLVREQRHTAEGAETESLMIGQFFAATIAKTLGSTFLPHLLDHGGGRRLVLLNLWQVHTLGSKLRQALRTNHNAARYRQFLRRYAHILATVRTR